jgi:VanZ family protein
MPSPSTTPSTAAPWRLRAASRRALRVPLGRFCRYLLPLILWMGLIFGMSTHVGASPNSASLLAQLLGRFAPGVLAGLSAEKLDLLNFLFRKLGHMCEYGMLTILAVRAFHRDQPGWRARSGLGAIGFSLLYAASDEWHQRFVADRTGTIADVGVDAIGVALAVALCWLWYRGSRTPAEELTRLADLRERGALTDEEFRRAKERFLG